MWPRRAAHTTVAFFLDVIPHLPHQLYTKAEEGVETTSQERLSIHIILTERLYRRRLQTPREYFLVIVVSPRQELGLGQEKYG